MIYMQTGPHSKIKQCVAMEIGPFCVVFRIRTKQPVQYLPILFVVSVAPAVLTLTEQVRR